MTSHPLSKQYVKLQSYAFDHRIKLIPGRASLGGTDVKCLQMSMSTVGSNKARDTDSAIYEDV